MSPRNFFDDDDDDDDDDVMRPKHVGYDFINVSVICSSFVRSLYVHIYK